MTRFREEILAFKYLKSLLIRPRRLAHRCLFLSPVCCRFRPRLSIPTLFANSSLLVAAWFRDTRIIDPSSQYLSTTWWQDLPTPSRSNQLWAESHSLLLSERRNASS